MHPGRPQAGIRWGNFRQSDDPHTAEGPLSLESMFEAGNTLIANPPSTADATTDRIAADQLVPTTAMRPITERLESWPVTMVNRPIKPSPSSGMRMMPLAREKVGGVIDVRRPLIITVEKRTGDVERARCHADFCHDRAR
jgi:hypothetical protein